ncbi:MAG: TetR/AcrR family transcriptional regulator [Chloroflexota bacterium]
MVQRTDPSQELDRRIRRTRRLLRDALMELITEKGYDAITVQDITDRADVARSTFYLHYRDKDELLFRSMREIYDDLLARVDPGAMDDPADFAHVAENASFYRVMLGEHGSMTFMVQMRKFLAGVMRQHIIDVLVPAEQPTNVPRELLAHFMAGAQLGMFAWWLENDMQLPAAEIAALGQALAINGLPWAISPPEANQSTDD